LKARNEAIGKKMLGSTYSRFIRPAFVTSVEETPQAAPAAGRIISAATPATAEEDPESFLWHDVKSRDTVLGLSLVYKVPVSAILLANDLPSSGNLALVPRVRIPRGAAPLKTGDALEASRRAKVREFRMRNSLPEAEAKFYLMEGEWDLDRAQAVLQQHLRFESQAGGFSGQGVLGASSAVALSGSSSSSGFGGGPNPSPTSGEGACGPAQEEGEEEAMPLMKSSGGGGAGSLRRRKGDHQD